MAEGQGTKTSVTTQVHEIYIRATPQAIWDAITKPEWTAKYGYGGLADYDLRPGGAFKGRTPPHMKSLGLPEVSVDGEVVESDPPRKLVQTYRFLFNDATRAEGFTRLTWEIEPTPVRLLQAHRDARARGRADHGRHGQRQVLGDGDRRLGVDSQRPEDACSKPAPGWAPDGTIRRVSPGGVAYTFGDFELDGRARQLRRNGERVTLSDRYVSVLLHLAAHAGSVVSKDALVTAGWGDTAVGDNSLEQAISALRRALGTNAHGDQYVETVPRQGYRLAAEVVRVVTHATNDEIDALLAPHRALLDGRRALESLERQQILRAREVFTQAVAATPDTASAHVGLAYACVLQFEMTRADEVPDTDALRLAATHAYEACRLDTENAEAWSTLGFILERIGKRTDAVAAGRKAIALEPDNWRHHFRLASTAWGEERLRAARRTLALVPGFALAHWLAASVMVARGMLDDAARELAAGVAAQGTRRRRFGLQRRGVALAARPDPSLAPGRRAGPGRVRSRVGERSDRAPVLTRVLREYLVRDRRVAPAPRADGRCSGRIRPYAAARAETRAGATRTVGCGGHHPAVGGPASQAERFDGPSHLHRGRPRARRVARRGGASGGRGVVGGTNLQRRLAAAG